jgi:hypothetical protein
MRVNGRAFGFILILGGAVILTVENPANGQDNGIVAQCVDEKSGALSFTAENREFCKCLQIERVDDPADPTKLRFEATGSTDSCKGKGGSSALDTNAALDTADRADEPAGKPGNAGGGGDIGGGVGAGLVVDDAETRPGWGHGDKNHEHTGPPGLTKNDSSGKASGKASAPGLAKNESSGKASAPGQNKAK